MTIPNAYSSPHIDALRDDLVGGKPQSLAAFWQQVHEQGTPLIEPLPNDDRHVLVTFLWRGSAETRNVVVSGGVADYEVVDDFVQHQIMSLSIHFNQTSSIL